MSKKETIHDVTYERQVIAGLLSDYSTEALGIVCQGLTPEHFTDGEYRVLYRKIIEMHKVSAEPINRFTFYKFLKEHPPEGEYQFNQEKLSEIADDFFTIAHYKSFVLEIIKYHLNSLEKYSGDIEQAYQEISKNIELLNVFSSIKNEGEVLLKNYPNLIVVGELENGEVLLFSKDIRKSRAIKISNLTEQDVISICGQKPVEKIGDFKNAITFKARDKQLYQLERRGQGIWKYKDKLMLINGIDSGIWENGGITERIDYPLFKDMLIDFGQKWLDLDSYSKIDDKAIFEKLELHFSQWNYRDPLYAKLLVALIIATPIQSIFPWKPHVYITGRRGTGKTTLVENIQELFGKLGLKAEGKTSEAGLRQHLQGKSLCVTIDEFEKFGNKQDREQILYLLRSSNRQKGGGTLKGTADQSGTQFKISNIVWLSSIESPLRDAADQSRFIKIELKPYELKGLKYFSDIEGEQFSQSIFHIGLKHYQAIVQKWLELVKSYQGDQDSRVVECYAVPCAIIDVITGVSGMELLHQIFEQNKYLVQIQEDEERLIETIITTKVTIKVQDMKKEYSIPKDVSIGELIIKARDDSNNFTNYNEQLNLFGLSVTRSEEKEVVAFCTSLVQRQLLDRTNWQGLNVKEILRRVPDAEEGRKKFGGRSMRTIDVPYAEIIKDDDSNKDDLPF
ncbi:MAG: hypothetical protein MUF15_26750 [Acidobacteria bacterium]|jgi:hypothetical protein|nr:hypothetical protein [Acidobacteriota bacterium]